MDEIYIEQPNESLVMISSEQVEALKRAGYIMEPVRHAGDAESAIDLRGGRVEVSCPGCGHEGEV